MNGNRLSASVAAIGSTLALMIAAVGPLSGPASAAQLPRNGRIAYSTGFLLPDPDLSGHSQVFTVSPDGSDVRQLTHVTGTTQAGGPDWSPDGARILYVSNATGRFQVWVMRADGSGQRRLVADPRFDAFVPRWSPDGRQLVFTRCETLGGITDCHLAVVRADGSGIRRITFGHWVDAAASFSPDGRTIVFGSNRAGLVSAIWTVGSDGSGLRRLTRPSLEAFWAGWAPDGTRLVFSVHCCVPVEQQISTMRPDGSGLTQLTHFHGVNGAFASYSPDGRKIILLRSDTQSGLGLGLSVMNADGTSLRTVISDPAAVLADWGVR
jgi:TolB protein